MSHEPTINTEKDSTPIIEWLTCKKLLRSYFTDQEILNALKTAKITVNDLTDKEDLENEPYQTPRELLEGPHYATVRRTMILKGKEWETTERALVKTWRVSARYQGLKHDKIIQALLSAKFKWFNQFKWNIYECSYREDTYEIYMKTENGSLYVPFKALMNGDNEAIKERMKEYFGWYYSGKPEYLKKSLSILDAKETIELFKLLGAA